MEVSAELSLVRKGIREKWAIPEQVRHKTVAKLVGLLDDHDPKNVTEAAKTLVAMDKVNVAHERNNRTRLTMSPRELTTEQLLAQIHGVLENDPILRQKLLSRSEAIMPKTPSST